MVESILLNVMKVVGAEAPRGRSARYAKPPYKRGWYALTERGFYVAQLVEMDLEGACKKPHVVFILSRSCYRLEALRRTLAPEVETGFCWYLILASCISCLVLVGS
jgi:hypothetical protein